MATEQRGFVQLASSNTAGFSNSLSNDLLIYTTLNSQKILIGTQNTNASLVVTSNSIDVSGSIQCFSRNPEVEFKTPDNNLNAGRITWRNSGNNYVFNMTRKFNPLNISYPRLTFNVGNDGTINNLTEVLTLDSFNACVGIGACNPAYKLDVNGDINFTGSLRQNGTIFQSGGGGIGWTSNATLNTIFTMSNVGINNTTPQETLHVGGKILSSTQFLNASGANSNVPCYSFLGDSNTGMYNAGADTLGFVTGGVERARFDASGRLGLGTMVPERVLDITTPGNAHPIIRSVTNPGISFSDNTFTRGATIMLKSGGAADAALQFWNAGSNNVFNSGALAYTFLNSNASTTLLSIAPNGNVGIGTNTPAQALDVQGNVRITGSVSLSNVFNNRRLQLWEGVSDHEFLGFGINPNMLRYQVANASDDHAFFRGNGASASVELMRIKGNGNVGINTASPSERLHVIGKILASDDITAFSDSNYKTNLEPITNAMNIIDNITGYKYNMIDDAPDSKKHVGVLAQQVETLLPEVVHTAEDGKKSVAYGNMIALLIQGMKEIKQEIQEIKSAINAA